MSPQEQIPSAPAEKTAENPAEELKTNPRDSAELITRYIEEKIIGYSVLPKEEEEQLKKSFSTLSVREKADRLYEKVMACVHDRQYIAAERKNHEESGTEGEFSADPADPELIAEIKVLLFDGETRKMFLEKYGEARLDKIIGRRSSLGREMRSLRTALGEKESVHKQLTQDLFLHKINRPTALEAAKGKAIRLAQEIIKLEAQISSRENLEGLLATKENTDCLARENYERLRHYSQEKFVWLPYFKDILKKIENVIQNTKKFPLLIGEPGVGKSGLARAAALELTGEEDIYVECGPSTGEKEMLFETGVDKEGSFLEYGALTRAFTGYAQKGEKECAYGRAVFLDEILKVSIDKIFSILKLAAQRDKGESLHRKINEPILPGALLIAATNPPGDRHGLPEIPPALDREFTRVEIDYPPADQAYSFALSRLMDENGHIAAAGKELAPAFKAMGIAKGEEIDGKTVVGKEELIANPASPEHGCLYRLCHALRAIQDSYISSNPNAEPRNLLRSKTDKKGKTVIAKDGSGDQIILSMATQTLKDINGFVQGFKERRRKSESDFQTESFTEFIKLKLEKFLEETNSSDRESVRAIFDHFHLFDPAPDLSGEKPLTPLEIGYLSPSVPRPLILKEKETETKPDGTEPEKPSDQELPKTVEDYQNIEVMLENGDRAIIKAETADKQPYHVFEEKKTKETISIEEGLEFEIGGERFTVAGIVDESEAANKPEYKNKIACQVGERKLYRLFGTLEVAGKGERFESWKNKLIKAEKAALQKYFKQTIDVPPLPQEITKEKQEFWEKNQFALHYSPGIEIKETDDFPGQKKKLDSDVYKWIKEGKISPGTSKLPKGWILIDTRPKPPYDNGNQMYENDILAPVLTKLRDEGHTQDWDGHESSRFKISNDELRKSEVKTAIAKALKVKDSQISLPQTALYNYLGNAFYPEWGETNSWEWFEEEFKGGRRLYGGYSVRGGLSLVDRYSSGDGGGRLGFRPLVSFSS